MQLNSYPGKLITFEGIDGSGKSQQFVRAKNFLAASQISVVCTKEPTDQPHGELIYDLLNGRQNAEFPHLKLSEMHRFHIQSLYFRDRIWNYKNRINPSLRIGLHVLSDRGVVSKVYGAKSPDDFPVLSGIEEQFFLAANVLFIWPDLNLIYDVPVELAMARLNEQGKVLDKFETEKILYRIRENYLAFAKMYPNCLVIDGRPDEQTVFSETRKVLKQTLNLADQKEEEKA